MCNDAMSSFQSYLDDLNSSIACCRSASLLIPTTTTKPGANDILCKLRQWSWICESVLIRPWVVTTLDSEILSSNISSCLPTEEELLFLQDKFALFPLPSASGSLSSSSSSAAPSSLREELLQFHIDSKSLIVPLTDDGTAFILRALFEMPSQHHDSQCFGRSPSKSIPLIDEHDEKVYLIQKLISSNSITIAHNCDGNQVVSLTKEVDSFPTTTTNSNDDTDAEAFTSSHKQFTFVDLFAGIGGFRIGLEALGGTCVGSCEIDPYARNTYRCNVHKFHHERSEFYVNDIARLDLPPDFADVICGGFPCQSFSTMASFPSNRVEANDNDEKCHTNARNCNKLNSNKRRGRQGGLDTPNKGKLFFHLPRILRKSRPKLFILENVKGLVHMENGSHFQKVLHLLEESGYHVAHGIIDSSWFLPQRRERVYFIGVRLDLLRTECRLLLDIELELKKKYQIYGNEIINAATMDKFDRTLLINGCHQPGLNSPNSLLPSCLGDVLESFETVYKHNSHCFLTPPQWQKVCSQTYIQFHADGTGRLLTEDDTCCQTLVSLYRQSYLMHSQFVVPRDSIYLEKRKEGLVEAAEMEKGRQELRQDNCLSDKYKDRTIPRFFTPREW